MHQSRLTTPPRTLTIAGQKLSAVGRLRMYVCGITPYDVTHLGHATTYIWADLADRVAQWQGHTVTVARNVTDVDEVLFAEARRVGQPYDMLAANQRAHFETTMATLRVRVPDKQPTAAQQIGHVIQLATALLEHDSAYEVDGTVFASVGATAFRRAGISQDEATTLAREYRDDPDDERKRHPLDVVLWNNAKTLPDPDISWPSPWGAGRPGWHAECASMVLSLFGSGIDLHCGGHDLAFPHHAVEADLAERAVGVAPFARAWMRPGIVSYEGRKMSKSLKNLVLADDLLEQGHTAAAIRLMCLDRKWHEPWEYTPAELTRAEHRLEALYSAAGRKGEGTATIAVTLIDELNVSDAVEIALVEGGSAARTLIEVLALA